MKEKRLSIAQRLSLDIITTLPQHIIETILCLLPIEEAARTSILSTEWRYKWTKIPKLVFSEYSFERSTEKKPPCQCDPNTCESDSDRRNKEMISKLFNAIHQVLLLRQTPIYEFTISANLHGPCSEIDQIILHLSRNYTIKKLTLDFWDGFTTYGLPFSFFSFHHLTDLYLHSCDFNQKRICNGFGSLESLSLNYIKISRDNLLHLLSDCPSLKTLCVIISKQDFLGSEKPTIMELFKCLPMIEHLTIGGSFIRGLVEALIPGELPASLVHLKYCSFEDMHFRDVYGLTFFVVLIKCSPNLEKMKLEIDYSSSDVVELEEYSSKLKEYSDVWLEPLNELEIENFRNLELEMEFVKFILARSSGLKKMILQNVYIYDKNEELELLNKLLEVPSASPVEIIVEVSK